MSEKPSYEQLETIIANLEKEIHELKSRTGNRKKFYDGFEIIEGIDAPVWCFSDRQTFGYVNRFFCNYLGKEKSEIEGKRVFEILEHMEAIKYLEGNLDIFENKSEFKTEKWLSDKNGNMRLFAITKTPFVTGEFVSFIVCVAKDITEQKMAKDSLALAYQELEATHREIEKAFDHTNRMSIAAEVTNIELNQIFNISSDAIWVIDNDFNVLRINNTMLDLLGIHRNEITGKKCYDLLSCSICGTKDCSLKRISGGKERVECDADKTFTNGVSRHFLVTATHFRGIDYELKGIVEHFRDITSRKQFEQKLENANNLLVSIAMKDPMTMIPNRSYFLENLEREWRRMKREKNELSLIICDIDCMKGFNDSYGHEKGDESIKTVVGILLECARRPGDFVARIDGEEFAVILPRTPVKGALHVAENIRNTIEKRKIEYRYSSVSPYLSISCGVAGLNPASGQTHQHLINIADSALYEAKKKGRNCTVAGRIETSAADENL